jgi:uncharacterized membrane protein
MKIPISEYKRLARKALEGQWLINGGILILVAILTSVITNILNNFSGFPLGSFQQSLLDLLVTIVLLFAFSYGTFYISLFVIRGGRANFQLIYSVFQSKYYFPLLLINLIETVVQFILTAIFLLPVFLIAGVSVYVTFLLGSSRTPITQLQNAAAWSAGIGAVFLIILVIFTIIVLSYIVSGIFQFAVLAKMDFPQLTVGEALQYSWLLVKDRIGQFLLLQLSFIGWYFLGILALGLGVFWVNAYQNVTNAAFYDEARKQKGNPQELLAAK